MTLPHEILRAARGLLGLSPKFVSRELRLAPGQLDRIEAGSLPLETALLDELSALYGLSAADVVAGIDVDARLEPIRVLFKNWKREIPEDVRSEIAGVAAARRDVKELEQDLHRPDRYQNLRARFRHEGAYGSPGSEWAEGKELAARLREDLGLGPREPIPSLRDLVENLGIELVGVTLREHRVAAFSLADAEHGPAIVINLGGANANPWIRRFVVAHELCHVLHDELTHQQLVPVQLYDDDVPWDSSEVGPEPRANGFAAHLLSPDDAVRARLLATKGDKPLLADQVRDLMEHFGINFKTARYRVRHVRWATEDEVRDLQRIATRPARGDRWHAAEAIPDFEYFPCPSVPLERRGQLARLGTEAWKAGILDRRQTLEILRAAPDEPIELLAEMAGG
jgi:Zn-dependent peptidase ImmA (M78 family)